MDHVVGGGKVEPLPARLQADEEEITLARLECRHSRLAFPVGRGAVQILISVSGGIEQAAGLGKAAHELAEHQRLVSAPHEFFHQFHKSRELRAREAGAGIDERGGAAGPAQLHQLGQDAEFLGTSGILLLGGLQRGEGVTAQRLVESPFIVGEIHFDNLFRARGKFRKDFTFGAAQDEGPDKRAQGLPGGGLAFRNGVFLRGRRGCGGKPFLERLPRTEQAGIDQVEQAPKILKAVFDGRARERHAEGCRNLAAGPGAAGVGVLERLRLIENGHLPLASGETFGFRMQQPVACDEHVAGAEGPHQCGPVAGAETMHRERGREAVEFVFPVVADGCGRNDD